LRLSQPCSMLAHSKAPVSRSPSDCRSSKAWPNERVAL
jgi:hypothetical protein